MNEHILDFLFKIVATRSLVIFFFVFSWYVSNHFCNLSFPWRLNSRRKCIIAGFMTEEIGENMFPLLRWDASGAQHQLVGVTKPLAFLIQSPCFHWTTASDFKQPLSTSPPTGGLNEIIWRSKHVEISSETVTITAWFVSLSSLVCLLAVCMFWLSVRSAQPGILLSCYWFVVLWHLEKFTLASSLPARETECLNCVCVDLELFGKWKYALAFKTSVQTPLF